MLSPLISWVLTAIMVLAFPLDEAIQNWTVAEVSISFIVSGWFCEVGGCGKKGAVRQLFPTKGMLPQKIVTIGVIY